ncbi:MAG: RidA family protein [Acidimicrobiales bacterium]
MIARSGGGPVGPYSAVLRVGTWVVTSGQVGAIPGADGTPQIVPGGVDAELHQALSNLDGVLRHEGAGLADVVKATVFLTDIDDYAAMNRIWTETFAAPRPTRSAVAVSALPLGARVEVEAWAFRPSPSQASSATGGAPPDHPG